MVLVHLGHGERHAGQPAVVDEQVEGLSGQQSHPVPEAGQRHVNDNEASCNVTRTMVDPRDPHAVR